MPLFAYISYIIHLVFTYWEQVFSNWVDTAANLGALVVWQGADSFQYQLIKILLGP